MARENKVKYGLSNVHYALIKETSDGDVSFEKPVRIPGAVSISMAAQGDQEEFYAENAAYYISYANGGYQGDLEIAVIPDQFRQDVLGEELDATDDVLVETAAAEGNAFALLYQFSGDAHNTLRVLYNCKAGRPEEASSTTGKTKTPKTEKLSITASPLPDGSVKAKTKASTPKRVRDEWFTAVWRPTQAEADPTQDEEAGE